jgi:hypothetical protein
MKMGLGGTGRKGEWHVEIDELIGLGLYGITIANRQLKLQIFEAPIDRMRDLLRFLKTSQNDECLDFPNAFGGRLQFLNHDGAVFIRIRHAGEHGPDLLEVAVEYTECARLAEALDEAIAETVFPE